MSVEYIYPGSSSFATGSTPFGTFDSDLVFQSDAPKVANWCAKRLGYPIQNVELVDESLFACFEEATSEYAAQVNQFNIRNNLDTLKGNPTGSNYSGKLVQGSNLADIIGISDAYGTLVGVGGNTDIKKGSIDMVAGQQTYDLDVLFANVSESANRIDVVKVFHEPPPASARFFDPYAGSGVGNKNLMDEFGFGNMSPASQFVMMPMFQDLLRMQAIELNDTIRKSAHSFNITNNKLQIFPIPKAAYKMWFEYFVRNEFIQNSTNISSDVVSDYANIGYDFIQYKNINDVGKQWIRKYSLALAKELLGAIREKYSSVPIPGSEISLDGGALRAEAQTEKDALVEQLRENLEELSRKNQFEIRNNESNYQQEMLRKVPLAIYTG
jgi:hypothetical protein|tara:strand:- start:2534 stop:3682 length:1149 start_codon:yes stop_codon:yes gene_type:complete